ncbi:synaptic vesicle transporter [Polychaeton citri CBS 116435]|uniref:Synaptic vesicle transporter n=1 Tax=Polychaeton citri CBS 116435 TaxID=1314669 RepID=A0A9P4QAY7_9PEZI|nr:synaptic vesicle transporter [Polychaeton citri CBS 116435]
MSEEHKQEEAGDKGAPYTGRPLSLRILTVAAAGWMAFTAPMASTAVFSALSEVSAEFDTTNEALNYSNAGFMLGMAVAAFIWNPIARIMGRKTTYLLACLTFAAFSFGAAASRNMTSFVIVRVLAGLEACVFLVAGQAVVAESFHAHDRGTAVGFFMACTTSGPGLGPLIGGVIVTFTSWRVIFWLIGGMAIMGLVAAYFVFPSDQWPQSPTMQSCAAEFNPTKVLRWLLVPRIVLTDVACGCSSWMMYSLLAPIRELVNPRFHLSSPLYSGLFYLAPAAGFLLGTLSGGRWADLVVRRWIKKRNGEHVVEDRLRSGSMAYFLLLPASALIYGWCMDFDKGGIPVIVLSAFASCFGLMVAFSSLNTYTAEAIPEHKRDIMASKYFLQYILCAVSTATIIPLIHSVGIGWANTISTVIVIFGGILVQIVIRSADKSHQQRRS